jgi:hypothetical protein
MMCAVIFAVTDPGPRRAVIWSAMSAVLAVRSSRASIALRNGVPVQNPAATSAAEFACLTRTRPSPHSSPSPSPPPTEQPRPTRGSRRPSRPRSPVCGEGCAWLLAGRDQQRRDEIPRAQASGHTPPTLTRPIDGLSHQARHEGISLSSPPIDTYLHLLTELSSVGCYGEPDGRWLGDAPLSESWDGVSGIPRFGRGRGSGSGPRQPGREMT